MITKPASQTTGHMTAGKVTRRISLALALSVGVAMGTSLMGASVATQAGASELKMPSSKSRLLRDRDDVTVIIIDKDDHRRSSSTSPGRVNTDSGLKQPNSRSRRDNDTIYIKRKSDRSHKHRNSGPKVIIVDQNRGTSCGGSGVCVIRP